MSIHELPPLPYLKAHTPRLDADAATAAYTDASVGRTSIPPQ